MNSQEAKEFVAAKLELRNAERIRRDADLEDQARQLRQTISGNHAQKTMTEIQRKALEENDFDTFLKLIKESGYSSYMYLQNVIPAGYKEHQDVAVSLALCEHYLAGRGAYRVHGGGFAGTVQAFVPDDILDSFVAGIDGALGEGACHVLSIRPQGGVEMEV